MYVCTSITGVTFFAWWDYTKIAPLLPPLKNISVASPVFWCLFTMMAFDKMDRMDIDAWVVACVFILFNWCLIMIRTRKQWSCSNRGSEGKFDFQAGLQSQKCLFVTMRPEIHTHHQQRSFQWRRWDSMSWKMIPQSWTRQLQPQRLLSIWSPKMYRGVPSIYQDTKIQIEWIPSPRMQLALRVCCMNLQESILAQCITIIFYHCLGNVRETITSQNQMAPSMATIYPVIHSTLNITTVW